jgi:hypothetical protein
LISTGLFEMEWLPVRLALDSPFIIPQQFWKDRWRMTRALARQRENRAIGDSLIEVIEIKRVS